MDFAVAKGHAIHGRLRPARDTAQPAEVVKLIRFGAEPTGYPGAVLTDVRGWFASMPTSEPDPDEEREKKQEHEREDSPSEDPPPEDSGSETDGDDEKTAINTHDSGNTESSDDDVTDSGGPRYTW